MPTSTLTNLDCRVHPMAPARGPLSQWVINALIDDFGDDAHLALYLSHDPRFGPIAGLPDAKSGP